MGEGIEGNADLERLLLRSHTDNFGHESLKQFFLSCSNGRTFAIIGHGESKNVDHAPNTVLSISVTNFNEILAQLNLDDGCQVPADLDNELSAPPCSRRNSRTVTKGCSLVMSNDEAARV